MCNIKWTRQVLWKIQSGPNLVYRRTWSADRRGSKTVYPLNLVYTHWKLLETMCTCIYCCFVKASCSGTRYRHFWSEVTKNALNKHTHNWIPRKDSVHLIYRVLMLNAVICCRELCETTYGNVHSTAVGRGNSSSQYIRASKHEIWAGFARFHPTPGSWIL